MISKRSFSMPRVQGTSWLLVAGLVLLSFTPSACAASIAADGGFESAGGGNIYFAGQSIDGGSWNVTLGDIYIDSSDPYVFAGSNSVNLTAANPYAANSLAETLSTVVGEVYDVSFWADADSANAFSLLENGIAVTGTPTSIVDNGFPGPITNSSLFVDYLGLFTATSTSTTLDFTATANPPIGSAFGSVMIDNVSVLPTPEPSSVVLTLTGVLGLVLGRKRLSSNFAR